MDREFASSAVTMIVPTDLTALSADASNLSWVGAGSFEERSLGSLRELKRSGIPVTRCVVVGYETQVTPVATAEEKRKDNLSEMQSIANELTQRGAEIVPVPAYSYSALQRSLEDLLRVSDSLIIDISCFTKIHTLAAACAVQNTNGRVYIAYSVPENYPGVFRSPKEWDGWRDVIIAPLTDPARFTNENSARGVVLVGHEPDRLVVALAEIEPPGGTVVVAASDLRPDLAQISMRRNRRSIEHLTLMYSSDWQTQLIDIREIDRVCEVIQAEAKRASVQKAPLVLFPYGPKPFLFQAAIESARVYPQNTWFVYPIPSSYDASYSEGISTVLWYKVARHRSRLQKVTRIVRRGSSRQ